jgi:hypothetical protein
LLFCVGDAYGLVMMILRVLLWNHTWLPLLNVSIYLSTLLNHGSGGGRCVSLVCGGHKKAPRSSQISVGDQSSPNTVAHFQMKEFRKGKIWI